MKKILITIFLMFVCANFSSAQVNKWTSITYSFNSGPVSPEYQKTYTITINSDRTSQISYHKGLDKRAPTKEDFNITKANLKKLNKAINKTGILDGVKPDNTSDGMIGGTVKSITITYVNKDPNLDQPPTVLTFNKWSNSPDNINNLFNMMDKMVPNKVWKAVGEK